MCFVPGLDRRLKTVLGLGRDPIVVMRFLKNSPLSARSADQDADQPTLRGI